MGPQAGRTLLSSSVHGNRLRPVYEGAILDHLGRTSCWYHCNALVLLVQPRGRVSGPLALLGTGNFSSVQAICYLPLLFSQHQPPHMLSLGTPWRSFFKIVPSHLLPLVEVPLSYFSCWGQVLLSPEATPVPPAISALIAPPKVHPAPRQRKIGRKKCCRR